MLDELVPAQVVVVEYHHDPRHAVLCRAEAAAVARAVERRRREFATGRHGAHRALHQLGVPEVCVPAGPGGEPTWPPGVVGSITHCRGYRAAAVAWAGEVAVVGIDAEPHEPLPDGMIETITAPRERLAAGRLGRRRPDVAWDRLLFSAKEAAFKAWYPQGRRPVPFEDVEVRLRLDGGFEAAVCSAGERTVLTGRWLVAGGLALTAVSGCRAAVARRAAPQPTSTW